MLKKISKKLESVSHETMKSTVGKVLNPAACMFQCADDCAWDVEIQATLGAMHAAWVELEEPT